MRGMRKRVKFSSITKTLSKSERMKKVQDVLKIIMMKLTELRAKDKMQTIQAPLIKVSLDESRKEAPRQAHDGANRQVLSHAGELKKTEKEMIINSR